MIASFVAIVIGVPFAVPGYQNVRNRVNLTHALAETDALDPGWRLEQMQANRSPVPDAENGTLQIMKVLALFQHDGMANYPSFKFLELPPGMKTNSLEHQEWIGRNRPSA
jgi:hypothetical protein